MKRVKAFAISILILLLMVFIVIPAAQSQVKEYKLTLSECEEYKKMFDDPRPYLKDFYKKVVPTEVYRRLTYDVEAMKKLWAECVGFRAPDVVGKIAPEIKPGKYTYKDKEKYPGLKELMFPDYYKRFNPSTPPHVGNFSEITVVPTRQYFFALPVAEATRKNMGRTKLDDQGYIINESYNAGYPFPQPDGKFKAQQIVYNMFKRYSNFENYFITNRLLGYTKNLRQDYDGATEWYDLRLHGRATMEPYGWFDERARVNGEASATLIKHLAPRDNYGTAFSIMYYLDPDKFDQFLIYINVLRRIRKMSTTDTQDPVAGQDIIYEDKEGFSQKLSPKRYPYKFEVISEREYLIPAASWTGSEYINSKNYEYHNLEFERRPMYVLKLTQLDKNYVYSQRILYMDKETFILYHTENYNQKGRLYRTFDMVPYFIPEMGMFIAANWLYRDHIDQHSGFGLTYVLPAPWLAREHIDLGGLIKKGK